MFSIKMLILRWQFSYGLKTGNSLGAGRCLPPWPHHNAKAFQCAVSADKWNGRRASITSLPRENHSLLGQANQSDPVSLDHSRRESSQPIGNLTGFRLYAPFYCVYSHPARWSPCFVYPDWSCFCMPWPFLPACRRKSATWIVRHKRNAVSLGREMTTAKSR